MTDPHADAAPPEKLLLIVEDDAAFARALTRSFERRGYAVRVCHGLDHSGLRHKYGNVFHWPNVGIVFVAINPPKCRFCTLQVLKSSNIFVP